MENTIRFADIRQARVSVQDGEIFSFTFGTLAHYDAAVFINGNLYSVVNGKTSARLYCW